MNLELYFAPGACSFVPHVALEVIKAATGQAFEPKLVKLHKGEHQTARIPGDEPERPGARAGGGRQAAHADPRHLRFSRPQFPKAGLLPTEPWARAQALSRLAWMNNSVHPTFTHVFRTGEFAESEAAQAEVKKVAQAKFRKQLGRIQDWIAGRVDPAQPYWFGERLTPHDAYAFTLLRWGGYAGIDPKSLPGYLAYVERVMGAAPVAAAIERERIRLDTYKAA